eukprot:TRINITY_DN4625_c0_g2_i2.p1 TRINITY_DN4625_c0_g2~~TRINITY_DN4625_c0_g2_i2.p1  ORF type:complete len:319 (+),score=64.22 TRINITY_DN4625_c0_g2_i2:135-1091(+)
MESLSYTNRRVISGTLLNEFVYSYSSRLEGRLTQDDLDSIFFEINLPWKALPFKKLIGIGAIVTMLLYIVYIVILKYAIVLWPVAFVIFVLLMLIMFLSLRPLKRHFISKAGLATSAKIEEINQRVKGKGVQFRYSKKRVSIELVEENHNIAFYQIPFCFKTWTAAPEFEISYPLALEPKISFTELNDMVEEINQIWRSLPWKRMLGISSVVVPLIGILIVVTFVPVTIPFRAPEYIGLIVVSCGICMLGTAILSSLSHGKRLEKAETHTKLKIEELNGRLRDRGLSLCYAGDRIYLEVCDFGQKLTKPPGVDFVVVV